MSERGPVEIVPIGVILDSEIQYNGDGTWTGRIPRLGLETVTTNGIWPLMRALETLHAKNSSVSSALHGESQP